MNRFMPLAAGALLLAFPAHAAEEDGGSWQALAVTGDVSEKVSVTLDAQLRWSDTSSRLGQYLIRPSLGLKLGKNTTASIGYAYFHTDPVGPRIVYEHRAWQQLSFRLAGDGKGVTLTSRSRLEERWVEGGSGAGWRIRQQLRLTAPLSPKVRAVVWSEAFVALNNTSWGQNDGLDRWRNFVGVAVPLSKSVTIEPGYLNQYVNRPGEDFVQHIGSVTLTAKL